MEVNNLIYTVRGTQVMIDSDLAKLYVVETKALNRAVKRNIERFPEIYRFQLTEQEYENLRYQIGTSSGDVFLRYQFGTLKNDVNDDINSKDLRTQNVTIEDNRGKHRKYLPYVFTEQGVAMLSAVLRSETAVKVSIQIINAFVEMRKILSQNAGLLQRMDKVETKLIENDAKFEQIFTALETKNSEPTQNIFFDGQIYDAYSFIVKLIEKAEKNIILIDNYVDNSILDMLSKKKKSVEVKIITHSKTKVLDIDIQKFNLQYPTLSIEYSDKMHDRFLLIDIKELYHIGASLKDLGKKCFAFSLMEDKELITNLLNRI